MQETPPPLHGSALALLTLSLSLGTFMQVLDTSIANVSIPAIAGDLAVSANQGTWVITSFAVSNAIFLPLTGWLAKRFGEVRLFVLATLLFSVASWMCGLAPNLPVLVAFRALQGAVAGPMIPLSQSLLLGSYPKEKKGLALALWSMTVVVAPITGPILGGWITDNISWPWIFYINVPVGILSAFLTWRILKTRESEIEKKPIDIVGLVLLVVGVGSLQVMLDKGNDLDWFGSTQIVLLGLTSLICLSALVIWELTDKHPVIDLHLFANRNFTVGTITISIGYMVFFGTMVLLPLWLQTSMGYTATWAGLAAAPIGIVPVLLSATVGRNLHKIDLRIWATFAFAVFALTSFWQGSFNTDVDYWHLVGPRFATGFGMVTFFVPLTALILTDIPPRMMASATGLANFVRILAGSLGTSATIALWDHRTTLHYSQLAEQINIYSPATEHALSGIGAMGLHGPSALALLAHGVESQAVMLGTNDIFWLSGVIFAALMGMVWFAHGTRHGSAVVAGGAH